MWFYKFVTSFTKLLSGIITITDSCNEYEARKKMLWILSPTGFVFPLSISYSILQRHSWWILRFCRIFRTLSDSLSSTFAGLHQRPCCLPWLNFSASFWLWGCADLFIVGYLLLCCHFFILPVIVRGIQASNSLFCFFRSGG